MTISDGAISNGTISDGNSGTPPFPFMPISRRQPDHHNPVTSGSPAPIRKIRPSFPLLAAIASHTRLNLESQTESRKLKEGGASRTIEIGRRETFYQWEYRGCVYSYETPARTGRQTVEIRSEQASSTMARTRPKIPRYRLSLKSVPDIPALYEALYEKPAISHQIRRYGRLALPQPPLPSASGSCRYVHSRRQPIQRLTVKVRHAQQSWPSRTPGTGPTSPRESVHSGKPAGGTV